MSEPTNPNEVAVDATPAITTTVEAQAAEAAVAAKLPSGNEVKAKPVTRKPAPVTGAVDLEPEVQDETPVDPYADVDRASDSVYVVAPGDEGGWAQLVMRSLGFGDAVVYDEAAADAVREIQEEAGLEPTGVVAGETWALILPDLNDRSVGTEVVVLRKMLRVPGGAAVGPDLVAALADRGVEFGAGFSTDQWSTVIKGYENDEAVEAGKAGPAAD